MPSTLEVDAAPGAAASNPLLSAPSSPATPASPPANSGEQEYKPPPPSICLLFSLLSRRDFLLLVWPALLLSIVAGGVAPFMTVVVGNVFNTFAKATVIVNPTPADKHQLLHDIGIYALELVGLAAAALTTSTLTSSFWIWTGERNVMILRKKVYASVTSREMIWFDTKMGAEDSVQTDKSDGPVGAGGLMAKFTRETDEVRMASSLASGMIVQHLTTCLACLVLAFSRSWLLTLVILSTVPVLTFIQAVSQGMAGPLLAADRKYLATAGTLVDRSVAAIATVKAFNAAPYEQSAVDAIAEKLRLNSNKIARVFALMSGFSQFTVLAMFVQAFWFGSKLVREGKVAVGDVMAVFWACLFATTNLQMIIPYVITLTKGKTAMSGLIALINAPTPMNPASSAPKSKPSTIVPKSCAGNIQLENVTFTYPSRPTVPVLRNVNLHLPADETTFIVGGSGSGKSTIAQLLLHMYDVQEGVVLLDGHDMECLSPDWTREHICSVSQAAILFDMSVHDNVAMGLAGPGSRRGPQDATREEVVAACKASAMHDFIQSLPEGYDTMLGTSGANLSGGQKQRLVIARAMLRDPTVLILDEATSALDATSRVIVFDAIKRWRHNRTTIVITHDLAQISAVDLVYVLKDGAVVQHGFRHELEEMDDGEFRQMVRSQSHPGGDRAEKAQDPWSADAVRAREAEVEIIIEQQQQEREDENDRLLSARHMKHQSLLRPISVGSWMFDSSTELPGVAPAMVGDRKSARLSRFIPPDAFAGEQPPQGRLRRPSTVYLEAIPQPIVARTTTTRPVSLQFPPTWQTYSTPGSPTSSTSSKDEELDEKAVYKRRSVTPNSRFSAIAPKRKSRAKFDDDIGLLPWEKNSKEMDDGAKVAQKPRTTLQLLRDVYPTLPYKSLFLLGVVCAIISGAITPIFSFMLSRLLFEVSIGANDVSTINLYGGIVLCVAVGDGLFMGLKYFILENAAMHWVTRVRTVCYRLILAQDKKWFDKTENSPARLMHILTKDGDDAGVLFSTVLGQCVVVTSMFSVGLVWALVWGWQLTLVGLAVGPVFALIMSVQTNLVSKCELRNKRAREDVAKGYYDTVLNIRGIRSMGFEGVFREQYDKSVNHALSKGVRGAFVEGCTLGVANSIIYLCEAVLFYASAVFVSNGTYTYLQMTQVLNLLVFTISVGAQIMGFTNRIAKSLQATQELNRLLKLSTDTDESRGTLRPPVTGPISFNHVYFAYPERPDVPVLKDVTLEIHEGESVAIVGASGSGKSTIAALLQRLYEPSSGSINVASWEVRSVDVHHIRNHVAVVSQNPNLFDATITDNIAYGTQGLSSADVQHAAQAANVHEFIAALPQGYDTMVGENAALISGGQAQRLQIARALARPANILILDECTSALDGANQAAVMQTIMNAKVGRTTLMVTHKLPVMRMCDRIVVVHEGTVAEQGSYEELMSRRGVFAQLASGGEWAGE
ncbi:P-loop containing nucleoside triphosphate hydrolase protein [Artomyces pyxidatus]|uniref:P-loop containing nucleoside triphosphate hydrolase protein n=1 Tax=Artomyces pyxidatus TaxID=48021 RepID=A0ACB8SU01_9AGAM|nr:P-loop containing nucleoside triphosphate hydrolase protein [Artomyces pyxidatus]